MTKKIKLLILSAAIAVSGVVSYGFADNYFEISKNLDIFATLFKQLNIYYVDETNPGELMKTSIDEMLKSLDPYTNYFPESDIEDYRFMTTGEYGGIGALIRKQDSTIVIAEPYQGFPAQKAGLMAGDIIRQIDGKEIEGYTTDEVSKLLKGAAKTDVKLTIERPVADRTFETTLTREDVKVKDVPYSGTLKGNIGYIKLNSFTQTASGEVKKAYERLKEENNIQSLILDLRGNGGGLLNEAVNIVNFFVPKGKEVVSTRGKVKQWDRVHRALNEPLDTDIPLVILINGMSASASEIVSGAIQDYDRGVVIGQKSFGKGLVQQTMSLSYNAKLKVTVAKYYIPSGRCIQKIDYSHRDKKDSAGATPEDSMASQFETANGRKVYDAAGIKPDINVNTSPPANITQSLLANQHVFDYATAFKSKHDSIPRPFEFTFTDEYYQDFVKFLKGKEYDYTTKTEKLLEDLKQASEKEKYYSSIEDDFETLKSQMKHNKSEDLKTFKDEIIRVLENEIVSRYYYQSGRVEVDLKYDDEVQKGVEILNSMDRYNEIISGPMAKKE